MFSRENFSRGTARLGLTYLFSLMTLGSLKLFVALRALDE
jgi:hypothetical protein